jgi:hypothetical protein
MGAPQPEVMPENLKELAIHRRARTEQRHRGPPRRPRRPAQRRMIEAIWREEGAAGLTADEQSSPASCKLPEQDLPTTPSLR